MQWNNPWEFFLAHAAEDKDIVRQFYDDLSSSRVGRHLAAVLCDQIKNLDAVPK